MNQPRVSVVMPVYNSAAYLLDAVASIIEQSMSDWELICINDGSTDDSGPLLNWLATQDRRIQVIHQENSGIVAALNRGCEMASGDWIARMDSDDIAMASRFDVQIKHMEEHSKCVVLGGSILEMDADSAPLNISSLPQTHAEIVAGLMQRRTGHFHPTTMIRADAFRRVNGYRSQYQWVEDHDLWLRLSQVGELNNLEDVVICYRQHATSVCWQRSSQQRELMNDLIEEAYQAQGATAPTELILKDSLERSAAGPGKWARAAAKGGYRKSAWKHLRQLNLSSASPGYKCRMNVEVVMRLLADSLTSRSKTKSISGIPTFADWHARWDAHQATRSAA